MWQCGSVAVAVWAVWWVGVEKVSTKQNNKLQKQHSPPLIGLAPKTIARMPKNMRLAW